MGGANVTASSTVTIALQSTTGVTAWSIICTSTNDLVNQPVSGINATLVVNQVTKTATFTAPSNFAGLQFTSLVNNGVDVNGTSQPSYSTTFGVWVLTATNRRVLFVGEKTEGDPVNGWVADINALIENDTSGPGSAGLGLFYNTGSFNVGLDTNGNITTPGHYIQLSNALSWASGSVSLTATTSSLSLNAGAGLLNLTGYAGINIASSLYAPTLQWLNTVTSPTFTQAATNVSNATGQTMLIQAQYSNTGAGAIGGQLNLASGGSTGGGSTGNVSILTGSTQQAVFAPTLTTFLSPINFDSASLTWLLSVTSPILSQANNPNASATGQALTVQAQNATGTTSTGGALNLTSGTGTSAAGAVNIQAGGTTVVSVASTAVSINQPNVQFGNTVVSPIIKQNNNTVNNTTGSTLTINSQNSTGTTSTGGNLALVSGTGTTAAGNITFSPGGNLAMTVSSTAVTYNIPTLLFASTASNPSISQAATSLANTNGQNLLIQAQNANGTGTSVGGNIEISPGTGTAGNGNIALFGTGSFGSGTFVLYIANATSIPSTNPSGGGILYVTGGALKYRGSSGSVTNLASA